jgi:hypothetical protein
MKFFSQLFDSNWRERGDTQSRTRQGQHYDSMPEQVMANRKEIMFLQSEMDRVSQDLAQAMVLNRTLVKFILSEKLCKPDTLEKLLEDTVQESKLEIAPGVAPSKFCEDCGRPLPQPGKTCPYCSEIVLPKEEKSEEPAADDAQKKKKKKAKRKKKKADPPA